MLCVNSEDYLFFPFLQNGHIVDGLHEREYTVISDYFL